MDFGLLWNKTLKKEDVSIYYGLNCVLPQSLAIIHVLKFQCPKSQDETVFADKVFKEIIKLK